MSINVIMEAGEVCVDSGVSCVDDGETVIIYNLDGFAGEEGLMIEGAMLTWEDVDKLKEAIKKGEELWRK